GLFDQRTGDTATGSCRRRHVAGPPTAGGYSPNWWHSAQRAPLLWRTLQAVEVFNNLRATALILKPLTNGLALGCASCRTGICYAGTNRFAFISQAHVNSRRSLGMPMRYR